MLWKRSYAFPAVNQVQNQKELVSLAYRGDSEYVSWLESYVKKAAGAEGFDIAVLDSKNSEAVQLAQVERAQRQEVKAIIVNMVNLDSVPEILRLAESMKVVFLHREPKNMSLLNNDAVYVGSKEMIAGKLQGEWLSNYFKERGKNKFRYILLQGPVNLPSTIQRTETVLQTLADNGITADRVVAPIVADYDRTEAMSQMMPILRSGVDFNVIIANNDAMALGAIEAMEYLNMDPARKIIVGVDATEPAVRALLNGKLAMTVFQNAKAQGETAVKAAINMLSGRPFDEETGYPVSKDNPYVIWIPYEVVTRFQIPKDLYF